MLLSIGAKPGNFLNEALVAQHEAEERVDLSGCDRSDHLKIERGIHEVHNQLVRAPARFAYRV